MDNIRSLTAGYDSAFESDSDKKNKKRRKCDVAPHSSTSTSGLPSRQSFGDEQSKNERRRMGPSWQSLNAYERHKQLINQYVLYHPGATKILQRDTSQDKTDHDILKENHKFLWKDEDVIDSWGKELAKKYYDKLFKEYCICDMTRYKENKIGMRWRIEKEVFEGRGQFSCGNKHCSEVSNLRTWEMNFAYVENNEKKNCLVKLRLCHDCSYKLNYNKKHKEIKKRKKKSKKRKYSGEGSDEKEESQIKSETESSDEINTSKENEEEDDIWKRPVQNTLEKSKEDEFEEYLNDLFV